MAPGTLTNNRGSSLLASARRYPGLVALLCTGDTIFLSGPASLWELHPDNGSLKRLATIPLPWCYRQAARFSLLRRLGRLDVRELIQAPNGDLLGVIQKQVVLIKPSGDIRPVLQVTDGGRPKGFALTPAGRLFVGEYWGNPRRQGLRVWASPDGGHTWDLAYTIPAGRAKHIHNIVWDPYRHGLWVLTGDSDDECALLFTADEFRNVTEVRRGGQLYRACQLFCRPEGLYYGTDSERAVNWFVYLDIERGKVTKINPLPGSSLYGTQMAGRYLISTAVEPSKVNHYRKTVLWASADLYSWDRVVEFEKDCWPAYYFGFGNITLPRVQGNCHMLVFSTLAAKNYDLCTFLINHKQLV